MVIKIKDQNSLIRDPHSKAILNVDKISLDKYRHQNKQAQKQEKLENDVLELKNEIMEIKTLLLSLVKG